MISHTWFAGTVPRRELKPTDVRVDLDYHNRLRKMIEDNFQHLAIAVLGVSIALAFYTKLIIQPVLNKFA